MENGDAQPGTGNPNIEPVPIEMSNKDALR